MNRPLLSLLVCWIIACPVLVTGANVNVGRYDSVHIVPAPGPVTIDGDLSDWDKSGEFFSYRFVEQQDSHAVRGYMMYDDSNLYIGAYIRDGSPMMNQMNPDSEAAVAWRGDCLQVRVSSDPALGWPLKGAIARKGQPSDRICHLTMWYFTPRQQPCLQIAYGMDYHDLKVNPEGFQGAYRMGQDRKGFYLEYAISWALLNAADDHPKAGDRAACVWQVLWSNPQGRMHSCDLSEIRNPNNAGFVYQDAGSWGEAIYEPKGQLPPGTVHARDEAALPSRQELGFIPIRYRLRGKTPVHVSMHITDADGRMVRWLLGDAVRQPGDNEELWDGLDNDGKPVPPGRYAVQWCHSDGVTGELLATADNPGTPPYNTSDNTGSWAGDYGTPVTVAATATHLFVIHQNGEASRVLVKATPDGRRVWGVDTTLDLYHPVIDMATDGAHLFVLQGRSDEGKHRSGFVQISCETGFNDPIGETHQSTVQFSLPADQGGLGITEELSGIAVDADHVFVSVADRGAIYAIGKTTGKLDYTIEKLDRPGKLTVAPSGQLLVLLGPELWRMNPDGRRRGRLVPGLWEPSGVWTDADGDIYVSVRGNRQQVLRYDDKGQLRNAIGRLGGMRVPGPWVDDAMRNPAGGCIGPDGNLWLAEATGNPKRTSVWTRDGAFVRDFIGPCPYSTSSALDAQRPQFVWVDNTRFEIDYKAGTTRPVAVVFDPIPGPRRFDPHFGGIGGHRASLFIHHKSGRTFVFETGNGLYEELGDRFVGLVAPGRINIGYEGRTAHLGNRRVLGTDWNLDGTIDSREMQEIGPSVGMYWGDWMDDDLNWYMGGQTQVWKLPCEGFNSLGLPLYDTSHMQLLVTTKEADLADHPKAALVPIPGQIAHVMVDDEGGIYLMSSNGPDRIIRGQGYLDKGHRLVKVTAAGKVAWEYRNVVVSHHASRNTLPSKPGEILGAIKFTGCFGRYLTVASYYGQYHVLDRETGLYIGAFTPDTRIDPPLDAMTVLTENFNGCAAYSRKLGKYLYAGGDANARVWEVHGLDTVRYEHEKLTVSDEQSAQAAEVARTAFGVAEGGRSLMVYPREVTVDGDLAEWDGVDWADVTYDANRHAKAAAAWHKLNGSISLYAAFQVTDASPMKNRGGDDKLLFKTGDCVEFCISSVPPDTARKDEKPLPGDHRILVTFVDDKPQVIDYEPASTREKATPATFRSPTGEMVYNHVGPVARAKAALTRTATGYVVELMIPGPAVGLDALDVGQQLSGDFGVLFSDQGGVTVLTRAMWADDHNEIGVNNDIPTESRLHPKRWGRLVLR